MRALAPADQPGSRRPLGQLDLARQLGDPRPVTRLAVLVDRRLPRRFVERQQGLAHRLGERIAEREADPGLAAGVGEIVACASRIGAGEDVPVERALGQLLERQVQQPQMVLRVVRAGVPGPEDTRQQLPPAGDQQRVEAEPALVMPGCLLLLGVHVDRSGIEVEDHPLGCRARRPRTGASSCPRRPDPFQLALADRQQHPPRGRHRRHLPEQGWLASQRGQVRDAPTTVGEHHRQVAEHPPRLMPATPLAGARERIAQPTGQPDALGDQRQQRGARTRAQTAGVRPDIYGLDTPTSHHLQGEPPERGDCRREHRNPPRPGGRFRPHAIAAQAR